jgi:23S rRNA pseudouridine2605 synthase
VAGIPQREVLDKLTEGIWLAEGKVRARRVKIVGRRGEATILEMVLAEGKNREVRRMLAKFGHKVMMLVRVAVGPITIKGLAPGEHRSLSSREVDLLRRVAAGEQVASSYDSERRPKRAEARPQRPTSGPKRHETEGPRHAHPPRPAAPGKPGGSRRPAGPPRPAHAGANTPRPEGLPPSQRPRQSGGPSGARPPRPSGPPPSQRPRTSQGQRQVPARRPEPESGPPARRIIGLDLGSDRPSPPSARRRPPVKRRPPRAAIGPRKARGPVKPEGEE